MGDHNQLDPPASEPTGGKRRWRLLWIVLLLLLILSTALVHSLVVNPREEWGPRYFSASNLRQIGQSIQMYSQDHDGRYPDSFGTLLFTEDVTSQLFVAPQTKDTPAQGPTTRAIVADLTSGGHLSYIYLGRGLTTASAKPNVVIAFERPVVYSNGMNVLFGDGHVEFVDPKVGAQIAAEVKAGAFPVTLPTKQ